MIQDIAGLGLIILYVSGIAVIWTILFRLWTGDL